MPIKERFLTVIVMNAILSLAFGIADALEIDGGVFDLMVSSLLFNLVLFAASWLVAPWIYNKLNIQEKDHKP